MVLALKGRASTFKGFGESNLRSDNIIEVRLCTGVAIGIFNLRNARVAVASPEVFERPATTGGGVDEVRNVRG